MWKLITDCGKQLTINSRVRETIDMKYKVYRITEVEFDQYHLELIEEDNQQPAERQHNTLSCDQLLQYRFEAEEKTGS